MKLDQSYIIDAPLAKVWQALTDVTVIEHWTMGAAQMEASPGGAFSLNEGDIYGTNLQVIPQQIIRQEWHRVGETTAYDVTFKLAASGEATVVRVAHDVDRSDLADMEAYWQHVYIAPLKQLLEGQASRRVRLRLTAKQLIAGNAWSFQFAPTEPLTWLAGQYIWVELLHDHPDAEGSRRWFTISSAPYEQVVSITTRLTASSFKRALQSLPLGGELELLEKPDGDFVWQDSPHPLVFIAGGIGITAFHSILKQRIHDRQPLAVTLIYGNRDDAIPFKEELERWAAADAQFTIRYLTGKPLTTQSILALAPQLKQSLVYISGPEPMVKTLGAELIDRGLPQSQLRLDALPHYDQHTF